MDNSTEEKTIILVSSESIRVPIKLSAAKKSVVICNYINDYPDKELYLKNIKYSTIIKLKVYLEHLVDHTPEKIQIPLPKKEFKDCITQWDYDFINCDTEEVLEIMVAANFLDIDSLLDLTSAKIASIIKGKNPEEIRRILNMENDIDEFEEIEEQVNSNKTLME